MAESPLKAADRSPADEPLLPTLTSRPSLRMLADRPLDELGEDRLGFGAYAAALAELIDNPKTHTPLTIALSAPWGAGKTSLARLVQRQLEGWRRQSGQSPHIVCWFNAWEHDDAPHLGAAFAADVARTVNRARPWWRRLLSPLPGAMLGPRERWRRRLGLAAGALIVALAVSVFAPGARELFESGSGSGAELDSALGARVGSAVLLVVAVVAVWRKVFAAADAAARFVDDPRSEASRGSMEDVKRELGQLIHQATEGRKAGRSQRRVVVFVDDLERCRPPRAVEVCEVASQLLAHPELVTVLIADMAVIAASAEIKYARLEPRNGASSRRARGEYGRLYLQKIVQIQFELPAPTIETVQTMLSDPPDGKPASALPAGPDGEADREPKPDADEEAARRARRKDLIGTWIAGSIMLGGALAGAVYGALTEVEGAGDRAGGAATGFFSGGILASFGLVIIGFFASKAVQLGKIVDEAVTSRRARRRLTQIDTRISELADENEDADPGDVTQEVIDSQAVKTEAEKKFVGHVVTRYFTEESPLRQEAEKTLVRFLGLPFVGAQLLPRSAKRMMNHLRLRLYMAVEGRALSEDSDLKPGHLAKWVVLEERWPELARGLKERPGSLAALEEARAEGELSTALAEHKLEGVSADALFGFLQAKPKIGPLAERLVFLEAVPEDEHSGRATLAPPGP